MVTEGQSEAEDASWLVAVGSNEQPTLCKRLAMNSLCLGDLQCEDRPPHRFFGSFCVCYCCILTPTEGLIIVISKSPVEGIDELQAFKPAGSEEGDRYAGWLGMRPAPCRLSSFYPKFLFVCLFISEKRRNVD